MKPYKIQKFIIQPVFQIIRTFRDQTDHCSGNAVGPTIFHDTDPFISLLDIKTVHKLICHYRIIDAVFYLVIVEVLPFNSKLRTFCKSGIKLFAKEIDRSAVLVPTSFDNGISIVPNDTCDTISV